MIPFETDSIL